MNAVTIRDALSHLTFARAAKLLGSDGKRLLSSGNGYCSGEFDPARDARFTADSLSLDAGGATVTLSLLGTSGPLFGCWFYLPGRKSRTE